jgi:hypothetical protein
VVVIMRAYVPWLALLFLPQLGCGGADEGRPPDPRMPVSGGEGGAGFDQCKAAENYEFRTLIDFEPYQLPNGIGELARCDPGLTNSCSFYFNYDEASSPRNSAANLTRGSDCQQLQVDEDEEVFTFPRIGQQSFPGQEMPDARCGEEGRGLNIVTENVGMCIGSDGRLGWGATLDVTFTPALDASDWDGISLWVKNDSRDGNASFILQFVDPYTSGAEDPETGEPSCDASDPAVGQQPVPDHEKCDAFGTAITLPDEWIFVPARFSTLGQKGFGVVSPLGRLKQDQIARLQIFIDSGDADFWIDDIALFRAAE